MTPIVLTPETVWNPAALEIGSAPRPLMDRIALLPRGEMDGATRLRVIFEKQFLRFTIALLPFVFAMLIWPDMALPIAQAPVPMLVVIGLVEMRVLRVPRHKRAEICDEATVGRALDGLNFAGRRMLSKIAAGRNLTCGELYLVVEQSELANVPPLTVISVQSGTGKNRLVALDAGERAKLREALFDKTITARDLHLANLREGVQTRTITYDARAVSGHARLAAALAKPAPEGLPA